MASLIPLLPMEFPPLKSATLTSAGILFSRVLTTGRRGGGRYGTNRLGHRGKDQPASKSRTRILPRARRDGPAQARGGGLSLKLTHLLETGPKRPSHPPYLHLPRKPLPADDWCVRSPPVGVVALFLLCLSRGVASACLHVCFQNTKNNYVFYILFSKNWKN